MPHKTSSTLTLLRELAAHPPHDEAERKEIAEAAYELARAVEHLYDQSQRLIYSHTIVPPMVTANDLSLFATLSDPLGKARSTKELADATGADPALLIRILRFLAAYRLIDQPDVDKWAGTAFTSELSQEGNVNGMKHHVRCHASFSGYENVEDPKDCPLQQGIIAKGTLFDWYHVNPDNLEYFMKWLPKHRRKNSWLDSRLVEDMRSKQNGDEQVLFVDIGGSVGNICVDLRKRLPDLRSRVFNPDLPQWWRTG